MTDPAQARAALERANAVRFANAEIRRWAMVAGARSDRVKVDELSERQRRILAEQLLAWHPSTAEARA